MPSTRHRGRQRGATLLISLIMLVVLTLFAITAIRTGNIGLKIVGNQQMQKLMESAAAQAVEQVVSNLGNFDSRTTIAPTATVAQSVCVNPGANTPPVVLPVNSTTPGVCPSGIQVDTTTGLDSAVTSTNHIFWCSSRQWRVSASFTRRSIGSSSLSPNARSSSSVPPT